MKYRGFLLYLLLLCIASSVYTESEQSYEITESQLQILEKNSKERENLLKIQRYLLMKQAEELKNLENQYKELEILQNKSENQIEILNEQLNQTSESLKQSESKNWKNKVIIATVAFSVGVASGIILANR